MQHCIADIGCWSKDNRDAKGSGYNGTQSVTKSGLTCQKWAEQSPHTHEYTTDKHGDKGIGDHNYCRNPDEEYNMTWCYTTSPDKRWDFCEVPTCETSG